MKNITCKDNSNVESSLKVGNKYKAEETEEFYIIDFGRVKGKFRKDRFVEEV